jgi:hypothetical protein
MQALMIAHLALSMFCARAQYEADFSVGPATDTRD